MIAPGLDVGVHLEFGSWLPSCGQQSADQPYGIVSGRSLQSILALLEPGNLVVVHISSIQLDTLQFPSNIVPHNPVQGGDTDTESCHMLALEKDYFWPGCCGWPCRASQQPLLLCQQVLDIVVIPVFILWPVMSLVLLGPLWWW